MFFNVFYSTDTNKILNYALAKQKDNLFMFFKDNSSLDYQRRTKRKLDISKISKRPITEFMVDKTKFPKRREFKQIYFDRDKEFYFVEKNNIYFSGEEILKMSNEVCKIPFEIQEYIIKSKTLKISICHNCIKYTTDEHIFIELKDELFVKEFFSGKKRYALLIDSSDLGEFLEMKNATIRIYKQRNSTDVIACVVDNLLKRTEKKSLGFCKKLDSTILTNDEILLEIDSDTLRREIKNSTEEGQDNLIKIIEGYYSYFFNNVIIKKSLYVFSFFEQGIITTWRKEKIKRMKI